MARPVPEARSVLTCDVEAVSPAEAGHTLCGAAQRGLPLVVAPARCALPRNFEAISPPEHADLQGREWGPRLDHFWVVSLSALFARLNPGSFKSALEASGGQ